MTTMHSKLPTSWVLCAIQEIAFKRPLIKPSDIYEDDFPYIDTGAVDNSKQTIREVEYRPVAKAPSRARKLVRKGDVIFSTVRVYLKNLALAKTAHDNFVCSTAFAVLTPKSLNFSEYLFHFLNWQKSIQELSGFQVGNSPPSMSEKDLFGYFIPLPPLAEQERIVDKIDELFSAIEAGERAIEQARIGVARYRKAILKAAVTGELTKDWRNENPTKESAEDLLARILTARYEAWEKAELAKLDAKGKACPETEKQWKKFRGRYKPPVEPETEGLPDLPDGWVATNGESLFTWSSGDFLPKKKMVPEKIPVYGGNGVNGYHNEPNVFHNTLVIGRVGVHCGNVHPINQKCWITDNAIYAISVSALVNLNYAVMAFRSARLGQQSQGGAQPFVNQTVLNEAFYPFPPVAEQAEIVNRVEQALSKADAVEATLDAQSRAAKALKQAVLKTAFEGNLVPQNPNDEPASELLKRIKAAS